MQKKTPGKFEHMYLKVMLFPCAVMKMKLKAEPLKEFWGH